MLRNPNSFTMSRKIPSGLLGFTGKGVCIGIVDSGMDIYSAAFRNEDGSTRIAWFWDQTYESSFEGRVYSQDEINEILVNERQNLNFDQTGHGTAVGGIAGGYMPIFDENGRENLTESVIGVAVECTFIVVKLGIVRKRDFPRTTQIMRAVNFCILKARELQMPLVINLSFGNTYGNHLGNTLFEEYLNNASLVWKTSIVVGSGNEADSYGHIATKLERDRARNIELSVSNYETALSIQLWCMWQVRFRLFLEAPSGEVITIDTNTYGFQRYRLGTTTLAIWVGEPSPYELEREIYMNFIPIGNYIDPGIWTIRIVPLEERNEQIRLYLPSSRARNEETRFIISTPELTLTVPSPANRLITVGAYNEATNAYAPFSGRGENGRVQKPELCANGVRVKSVGFYNRKEYFTGTSFAAPFITGIAALLMEYGIVNGNDPFLYGAKLKAQLIRLATPLPGERIVPNEKTGYGKI